MNDALSKGLTEHSASRRGARLRFERQRLTCIRCLYFKLGSMANASTQERQSSAQVSLAPARCAAWLRHRYQAPHLGLPVRLSLDSKGGRRRQRNLARESEDRSLRETRKPCSHKLRQRGAARQQATESQLTFDLSGPPKAGPLEGRVRPSSQIHGSFDSSLPAPSASS